MALPWDAERRVAVGEHARARGVDAPARLVSSAKSWLCHPGVDRRARDPAAGAPPEDVAKISPVEASAATSSTCARRGTHAHPDAPLAEQDVDRSPSPPRSTPPRASSPSRPPRPPGSSTLTLLEEPQAALYAWLAGAAATAGASRCRSGDVDPRGRRRRRHHRLLADRGARDATATSSSSASPSAITSCSAATTWTSRSRTSSRAELGGRRQAARSAGRCAR